MEHFDQIIVSGSLLSNEKGLAVGKRVTGSSVSPFADRRQNTGVKPYRTYNGFSYLGGFSDHLPVYVDLVNR
jgi:hypothetical protein